MVIVASILTFASSAEAKSFSSLLQEAKTRDSALRKDERKLRMRHHIEAVLSAWKRAEAAARDAEEHVEAVRGYVEAWALLAHWSGRRADRAQAKAEKNRLQDLEREIEESLAARQWLRDAKVDVVAGRLQIRLSVSGDFSIEWHSAGEHRLFFDLAPVVAVKELLDEIPVSAPEVKRLRIGQYDDDTARVVIDFAGDVERYAEQVQILDGRTISIGLEAGVEPRAVMTRISEALEQIQPDKKEDKGKVSEILAEIVDDVREAYPDVAPVKEKKPKPKKRSAKRSPPPRSLVAIRKVVIDAGHGGKDRGASKGGVLEKDLNLSIAKKLGRELEALGVRVVYTRTKDKFVSLKKRAQIANRSKADLFISIHANANRSSRVHGIETYYLNTTSSRYSRRLARRENGQSGAPALDPIEDHDHEHAQVELPDNALGRDLRLILADLAMRSATAESKRLAGYVQGSLIDSLRREYAVKDLGVKHALFYVLLGVRMPSVLIETGFVTHAKERKRLASGAYQTKVARAIAGGVRRFVEEREDLAQRAALEFGEGGLAVNHVRSAP